VEVKSSAKFEAGVPKALFETRLGGRSYDVSRDGRFLIPTLAEQAASAPMTVVVARGAECRRNFRTAHTAGVPGLEH